MITLATKNHTMGFFETFFIACLRLNDVFHMVFGYQRLGQSHK